MALVTLRAHFDGTSIQLDEPFDLPPDAQLMVTVLMPSTFDSERAEWLAFAAENLARAYSDDEPEYTDADIRP